MKRKRLYYLLAISLVVVLLGSGFLAVGFAAEKKSQTGDVVYALSSGIFYNKGGDPATHTGGLGPIFATIVFDSLIFLDMNSHAPHPALATSWKIAPDWSYMDFNLRKDVKFHNGENVTAEDVAYSFETFRRPELKWVLGAAARRTYKNFEALDKYKVRLNLNSPSPGIYTNLTWGLAVFPKKYREAVGDAGFADKPVGAGPFKWVDYKQDVYIKVEALEQHYRKTPEIKTLKVMFVPEHSTRLAMLKAGEADIIALTGAQIPQIKADPNLREIQCKYTTGSTLVFADLAFPDKPSPFLDIRVREAVSLAIDRKTICERILFGGSEPYGEALSPVTLGWDSTVKPDPYNPEKAKALLTEAGYPNGFETVINTHAGSRYYLEAVASNLSEVGIKAKLEMFEGGAFVMGFRGKKLQGLIPLYTWYDAERYTTGDQADFYISDALWCYHTTPEIEQALKDSKNTITDQDGIRWGRKVSKLIREARLNAILWADHSKFGVGPKIVDWPQRIGTTPSACFEFLKIKH